MPTFLAILFPFIAAVGFNEVYNTIKLIWQGNRLEAQKLEATFELYMRRLYAKRWQMIIWSSCYLLLSAGTFAVGVLSENSLFVSLGGLAITLYIALIGLAIKTIVSIHQRITVHNSEVSELLPAEFNGWLKGMGVMARPFRLIDQNPAARKELLEKIELGYIYAMVVVLFFTFSLGIFPSAKIWIIAIVIFSGSMLWLLLSRLLGEDPKKALKFLKVMVMVWVLLILKLMITAAMFPNIAMAFKTRVKPLFEDRVSNFMVDLLTPSPTPSPLPTACPTCKVPVAPKLVAPPPMPPLTGSVSSGNTYINNSTNSSSESSAPPQKKRSIKEYLDAHMPQVCKDFPDLEKCKMVEAAILSQSSITPSVNTAPSMIELPAVAPAIQPKANDTLNPFDLPPVKQLP